MSVQSSPDPVKYSGHSSHLVTFCCVNVKFPLVIRFVQLTPLKHGFSSSQNFLVSEQFLPSPLKNRGQSAQTPPRISCSVHFSGSKQLRSIQCGRLSWHVFPSPK